MSNNNTLALISNDIYSQEQQFNAVLTDKSISFEKEAGFALQIMATNDYCLKVAANRRDTLINAVTNIAAIGISLNPAKKQAYLVPRGGAICLDISYMGLIDLAMATGSIKWAQAEVVRELDSFSRGRLDELPVHSFNPFAKDRGAIIGVYVVVKTAEGDYLTHTMEIGAVYAIRDRSESFKSGKKSPWTTDEVEMIKKTCVKQAYKYWPKTDRLEKAIHHLNTEGGEGLRDINQPERGDNWVDVKPLIAALQKTTTSADALKFWKQHRAKFANQPNDYDIFKRATETHRINLGDDPQKTSAPAPTQTAKAAEVTDVEFVEAMDKASGGNTADDYIPE